jgi:hypothetical protein
MAGELQEVLGQRLVAYAVGLKSPRLVGRWADGDGEPRAEADARLRELYQVVVILKTQYGPETIRAFVMGANPDLRDQAPVEVVRDGRGIEAIHAASAFLD